MVFKLLKLVMLNYKYIKDQLIILKIFRINLY